MRLKALVEIYTMHYFAQLQNHTFFEKLVEFAKTSPKRRLLASLRGAAAGGLEEFAVRR